MFQKTYLDEDAGILQAGRRVINVKQDLAHLTKNIFRLYLLSAMLYARTIL